MSTTSQAEIEKFEDLASKWWDPEGPMKPLHKLNPTRIKYIKTKILQHFETDTLKDLRVLDIGCGAGLVCEPLARLGAKVTGLDAATQNIEAAIEHASENGLDIEYINKQANDFSPSDKFDVVLGLEIIEHVDTPQEFIDTICSLVKSEGLIIVSTLNRNPKSFLLGIVAAEYLLGWLPKGTHNWQKFIKPSELIKMLSKTGFYAFDLTGLVYNPLKDSFAVSKTDIDVNYFVAAHNKKLEKER